MDTEQLTKSVLKAIRDENLFALSDILEKIGFKESYGPHRFSSSNWYNLSIVLRILSAYSRFKDENFFVRISVLRIIKLVFMDVDIFDFITLIDLTMAYRQCDSRDVPKKMRGAFRNNMYSDEIDRKILTLDPYVFHALIRYILNNRDVNEVDVRFSLSIMQYVHSRELVSDSDLLCYIALCPRVDFERSFRSS